jgi:hypothetical protein
MSMTWRATATASRCICQALERGADMAASFTHAPMALLPTPFPKVGTSTHCPPRIQRMLNRRVLG